MAKYSNITSKKWVGFSIALIPAHVHVTKAKPTFKAGDVGKGDGGAWRNDYKYQKRKAVLGLFRLVRTAEEDDHFKA